MGKNQYTRAYTIGRYHKIISIWRYFYFTSTSMHFHLALHLAKQNGCLNIHLHDGLIYIELKNMLTCVHIFTKKYVILTPFPKSLFNFIFFSDMVLYFGAHFVFFFLSLLHLEWFGMVWRRHQMADHQGNVHNR